MGGFTHIRHVDLLLDMDISELSGPDIDQIEDLNIVILVKCTNRSHQIGVPIISWYRYLWTSVAMVPEHPIWRHLQVVHAA